MVDFLPFLLAECVLGGPVFSQTSEIYLENILFFYLVHIVLLVFSFLLEKSPYCSQISAMYLEGVLMSSLQNLPWGLLILATPQTSIWKESSLSILQILSLGLLIVATSQTYIWKMFSLSSLQILS